MHVMCHMRRRIHACHVRICTTVTSGRGLAFATRQQHISNTLATHQQHISNTLATHQQDYLQLVAVLRSQHVSNTLATHQHHLLYNYKKYIFFLFYCLRARSWPCPPRRAFSLLSPSPRVAPLREKKEGKVRARKKKSEFSCLRRFALRLYDAPEKRGEKIRVTSFLVPFLVSTIFKRKVFFFACTSRSSMR